MNTEPDIPASERAERAYEEWRADPTPDRLNRVVRELDPVINYKVSGLSNAGPGTKHQARLFAAQAIPKYDPAGGTKLRTFVQSHLKSLNRYNREHGTPVKVPERAQLDAWHLEQRRREFVDAHGQEPDVTELADISGMPPERIARIRRATRMSGADSQQFAAAEAETPDHMDEAMEYVYHDSDRIDRLILEMTTGYGGRQPMPKNEVARALGVSPSQVTRRAERLGRKIQDLDREINEIN